MASYKQVILSLNNRQTRAHVKKNDIDRTQTVPEVLSVLEKLDITTDEINRLKIIHIAGTKGKGSTCAYIEAMLRYCDENCQRLPKIGLFTSPHVQQVRERIRINSEPLSEQAFTRYYNEVAEKIQDPISPSYFKFLTVMAFHVFVKEKVDVVICEVGMGGRNDATNVMQKPAVTAITALGLDHVGPLGGSIEEITRHKAGIMKTGCSMFTVPQYHKVAERILQEEANKTKVQLNFISAEQSIPTSVFEGTRWPQHQQENAALAAAVACHFLDQCGLTCGAKLISNPKRLRSILEAAQLPARTQYVLDDSGCCHWYIDCAHTKESIQAGVCWFRSQLDASSRVAMIFGHRSSRNSKAILGTLYHTLKEENIKIKHAVFCTTQLEMGRPNPADLTRYEDPSSLPLAIESEYAKTWSQLHENGGHFDAGSVSVFESIEEAVKLLRGHSSASQPLQVLITGSLRVAGAFNSFLDLERTRTAAAAAPRIG